MSRQKANLLSDGTGLIWGMNTVIFCDHLAIQHSALEASHNQSAVVCPSLREKNMRLRQSCPVAMVHAGRMFVVTES